MSDNAAAFVGSIPENYDRHLGPMIFVDYAADLAARVAAAAPKRVLETAAGTGILTRHLRDHLPAGTEIIATDLNPPMIAIARAKFAPSENVAFEPADALALPFPDGRFDAVACQFGVMFYPDKEQSYREVRRVLAPGGRYLFNVWDSHRHNAFGRITHAVAGELFPENPPQFMAVPFSYGMEAIKDSLVAAGFRDIAFAVVRVEKEVPDAASLARGFVYGSPLFDQIKERKGLTHDAVVETIANALRREFGPDPGRASLQAIVCSAIRP